APPHIQYFFYLFCVSTERTIEAERAACMVGRVYGCSHNLTDNLGRLALCLEQLLTLLALLLDGIVFIQELLEERLFVQLADETVLDNFLAVVDQQVHDGLGNLVGNGFPDNVEIGADKGTNELRLHGLAIRHGGLSIGELE